MGVDTSTTGTFVNVGTSMRASSMQRRLLDRGPLGTEYLDGDALMSTI